MPKYAITASDGGTFEIDANDDAQAQRLESFINERIAAGETDPTKWQLPEQGRYDGQKQIPSTAPNAADVDPEGELFSDIGGAIGEVGAGVLEGGARVLDKAAGWAESGLNAVGGVFGNPNLAQDINQFGAETIGSAPTNDLQGAVNSAMPATPGLDTLRGGGRFVGEAIASTPVMAIPGGALAQGAAGGALLSDADTPAGIAMDAGLGAVGARLGQAAFGGAANVANPRLGRDQRLLIDEGVPLTTGDIAGRGSQLKRLEDIGAGIPVVGGAVANAQREATVGLNRAAANRALRPIGERVPRNTEVGHDSVRYAGDRLSEAYGQVLPQLSGTSDRAFSRRLTSIIQRADLPEANQPDLQNLVREVFKAFRQRNVPTGETVPVNIEDISRLPTEWAYDGRRLRDASERLGDIASGYRRSDNPYERDLGDVAQQLRDQLHSLARRGNPDQAQRLRDIDRGYASLVRLERASLGTADGVATPAQYDAAVRGTDRSARRRQSARGQALDQDLSGAARRVMQNTAAQGGSRDINALAMLGGLGLGAAGGAPGAVLGLGGLAAARGAYSPAVQDAVRQAMTRQVGPGSVALSNLLRQGAVAAPVIAPALIDEARR